MPGNNRPGNSLAKVAISIAVRATLRRGTGISPIPTRNLVVAARTVAAQAIPDSAKQSSHSQSSGMPANSAARATSRRCSGGWSGGKISPTVTMWSVRESC